MKRHSLRLLEAAENDLQTQFDWYEAEVSREFAVSFRTLIDSQLDRISERPELYPKIDGPVRRCVAGKHGIFYVLVKDEIVVLTISHFSRRPGGWQKRFKSL